jgi:monoamine oxidase
VIPGEKVDCAIIGAGAAGLAALAELDRAGVRAVCLEARDRIGGRAYTLRDPLSPIPIELGAEFVHGRPPQIWDLVRSGGLMAYRVMGSAVHVRNCKVQRDVAGWEIVDKVMDDMRRAAKGKKDRSFSEFLKTSKHADHAKQLAASYVEGFNAARKELISIQSLAQDAEAADRIDGNRSFRLAQGYGALMLRMVSGVRDVAATVRLNCESKRVEWDSRGVKIRFRSTLTGREATLQAPQAIVAVPLGVLQCGSIAFDPEPARALEAARALKFGQVVRVVFRFHEPFWEEKDEFADTGFLLSDQPLFPTWWTCLPVRAPILTGWSAGPHADGLIGKSKTEIVALALADLSKITTFNTERLNRLLAAAYFHDWHDDPLARGAYSYVPVGALGARERLATAAGARLYFAGEATDIEGHSATVHGAIASGRRAARQILEPS